MTTEDTSPEATQDDAAAVADALKTETTETTTETENTWSWSESVTGEGEAPEWFKGEKYKTVEDQAKAYTALEGKFGSFTGAPEEYTVSLSEELQEKGVEFAEDDPLLTDAKDMAKELGMNQEGFERMLNMYATAQLAETQAIEELRTEQLKELGNNGQERVDNLDAWAKTNLSADLYEGFKEMAISASAVKAMERLVAMTRGQAITPSEAVTSPSVTEQEVKAMQFEKDEHGNRKIATDPAFRKEFQEKAAKLWGSEEARTIVG